MQFGGKALVGAIPLLHIGRTTINYSNYRALGGPGVDCLAAIRMMVSFTSILMFMGRATLLNVAVNKQTVQKNFQACSMAGGSLVTKGNRFRMRVQLGTKVENRGVKIISHSAKAGVVNV